MTQIRTPHTPVRSRVPEPEPRRRRYEEPEEEAAEEEDIVQHVSPLTDMDSLAFYLWVEEGAQAEADRRQNKPSKPPKAE